MRQLKIPKSLRLTPVSKRKPKLEGSREAYDYSVLGKFNGRDLQRVNVYAVVLDASSCYYNEDNSKYLCTIKLIDETVNPLPNVHRRFIQLTVYARLEAEIPAIRAVGSILRIHRADLRHKEFEPQLNCDVAIKASWVLWHHSESFTPLTHTGKKCTQTREDEARITGLRSWANTFFANHSLPSIRLAVAHKDQRADFDLLVYVLEIKAKDKDTILRVCDESSVHKVCVSVGSMIHVSPREITRFRSCYWVPKAKKPRIMLQEHSNIMSVPDHYYASQTLRQAMEHSSISAVQQAVKLFWPRMSGEVVTKIIDPTSREVCELQSLVHLKTEPNGDLYRVRVSIIAIYGRPTDWLLIIDRKDNKT
jgi:hypothetical protein